MSDDLIELTARLVDAFLASWSVADDPTSQAMARRAAERNADTAVDVVRPELERLHDGVVLREAQIQNTGTQIAKLMRNAHDADQRAERAEAEVERLRAELETFKAPDDFHNADHRARRLEALTEQIAEMAGRPPQDIAQAAMLAADAAIWAMEREQARTVELARVIDAGAEVLRQRAEQAEASIDHMRSLIRDLATRIDTAPLNGDQFTLTLIRQIADQLRALSALTAPATPARLPEAGKPLYELPVTDQSVIDSASPEVSRLANCVGYALAERGVKLTADDTFAAAHRLVNQGLAAAHPDTTGGTS